MSLRVTQNIADVGFLICIPLLLAIVFSIDAGATAAHVGLYYGAPFVAIALTVMLLHAKERSMRAEDERVAAVSRSAYRTGPHQLPTSMMSYRQEPFRQDQPYQHYDRG